MALRGRRRERAQGRAREAREDEEARRGRGAIAAGFVRFAVGGFGGSPVGAAGFAHGSVAPGCRLEGEGRRIGESGVAP